MKLYALLIGINDYASNPLYQCVKDAGKMATYLNSLKSKFEEVKIQKLLNKEATRDAVIQQIQTFFADARDEDVALVYYSGHGAQEESGGLFPEEQDGLLECMVCYAKDALNTKQLVADKELRYLFSRLKTNPHLITIFDACHSGDIVRAFHMNGQKNERIRRLSGAFDARPEDAFVFSKDKSVQVKNTDGKKAIRIPAKNHIHLSACLSSESSWEDDKGGVFTRYLLELLKATKGNLTYLDISRWAKISLKSVTQKTQTPMINVQGEGKLNAYSPWLNLNPAGSPLPPGMASYNVKKGWIYSRGSLLGVRPGMNVMITLDDGKEETVKVKEVDPENAFLEVSKTIAKKLDAKHPPYPARTETSTYASLNLYINDIDADATLQKSLESFVSKAENVKLVPEDDAGFYLNHFNGMLYFSLPEHEFQPLAEQMSLPATGLPKEMLTEQLKAFVKWHHFFSLDNPGKDFDTSPIKVSVKGSNGKLKDVTNDVYRLVPKESRTENGELYQELEIKITNTSKEKLYVGVLTLGSDLSITSNPFDGIVIELPAGASKTLYDHKANLAYVYFDRYKEVYNWKEEWFCYKFIFNNFEDFTSSLNNKDFLQPALNQPKTIEKTRRTRNIARGEGGDLKEVKKKWGTCITRIELENSTYNMITGDLKELADAYAKSEELAPFIKELYFEEYHNGKNLELRLKQNKNQSSGEANRATDNLIIKFLNSVYKAARRRKFNHQKHRTGPVVVAEGDSWFLFPKPGVRDTLDYIMDKYRLLSLAEAGDEIKDYLKNKELLKAVKEHKPKFVLISGGGNDILGSEIKTILKSKVQNGKVATDFIDEQKFKAKLKFLTDGYVLFFDEIKKLQPGVRIFVHGYDYVRSNPDERTIKKGWANKYMIDAGITDPKFRKIIISYLVDTFNTLLEGFAGQYAHVTYVNNRNTVLEDEWMDEIHPNNTGYSKVASNFLKVMK